MQTCWQKIKNNNNLTSNSFTLKLFVHCFCSTTSTFVFVKWRHDAIVLTHFEIHLLLDSFRDSSSRDDYGDSCINTSTYTNYHFMARWILSGTTRVSWNQKNIHPHSIYLGLGQPPNMLACIAGGLSALIITTIIANQDKLNKHIITVIIYTILWQKHYPKTQGYYLCETMPQLYTIFQPLRALSIRLTRTEMQKCHTITYDQQQMCYFAHRGN